MFTDTINAKQDPLRQKSTFRYIYPYSNSKNPVTYFHLKILALAGIWTQDLTGSKPICYQLSYPGLDE